MGNLISIISIYYIYVAYFNCYNSRDVFQCEEREISLIQRTSQKEETLKEEKLAESIVNISYDEQRVDLNILQRSQQAQQKHTYGLKSSLKLPLSYQVKKIFSWRWRAIHIDLKRKKFATRDGSNF